MENGKFEKEVGKRRNETLSGGSIQDEPKVLSFTLRSLLAVLFGHSLLAVSLFHKIRIQCAARNLPRDLRYLYKRSGFAFAWSEKNILAIRDLPVHMEELRLFPSMLSGTFDVHWLPRGMRIFILENTFHSPHLRAVVRVNNAGLPDSLEWMSVFTKKVDILPFEGSKVDPRVKKVKSGSIDIASEYYQKCVNLSYGRQLSL